MRPFAVLLVAILPACTSSSRVRRSAPSPAVQDEARAEETPVVLAALLCAYTDARARADVTQVVRLDDELGRVRGVFRALGVEPRPCSDPLIRRLAGCIRVWPDAREILSEWRTGAECSSPDVALYK